MYCRVDLEVIQVDFEVIRVDFEYNMIEYKEPFRGYALSQHYMYACSPL